MKKTTSTIIASVLAVIAIISDLGGAKQVIDDLSKSPSATNIINGLKLILDIATPIIVVWLVYYFSELNKKTKLTEESVKIFSDRVSALENEVEKNKNLQKENQDELRSYKEANENALNHMRDNANYFAAISSTDAIILRDVILPVFFSTKEQVKAIIEKMYDSNVRLDQLEQYLLNRNLLLEYKKYVHMKEVDSAKSQSGYPWNRNDQGSEHKES